MACIQADTPFTTVVIYGQPDTSQEYIDLGRPRVAADFLTMAGNTNSVKLQAAARVLMSWKNGPWNSGSFGRFTVQEILAMVRKHPKLAVSVRACEGAVAIPFSTTVALHYVGANLLHLPERARAMIDVLTTGIPDYDGDPIHKLRERILTARVSAEARHIKRHNIAGYAIHAWNAFAEGRPLYVVKLPKTVVIEGLDPDLL
jgi:hypothetical protein